MKKIKIDMTTGILLLTIIALSINFYMKNYSDKKENFNQNYWISINGKNYINNIEESEKINEIEKVVTENCSNNEDCEIKNIFDYVKNIPYVENNNKVPKYPLEVINSNGGDCDEKSFLIASLLKVKKHEAILIACKYKGINHMFVAIKANYSNNKKISFIKIKDKKYYIAESTRKENYIGAYNGIDKNDYIGIYDINNKKNIKLTDIQLIKNI